MRRANAPNDYPPSRQLPGSHPDGRRHPPRPAPACMLTALLVLLLTACGDGVDALQERAEQQRAEGRLNSAIADYRRILEQDPDHAEARLGLGEISLILGDYPGAEDALQRAVRLGVAPERVQSPLARALLWQEKPKAVLDTIDADKAPDNRQRAELLAIRAEAHRQLRQTDRARNQVNQALALDPASIPAIVTAGRIAMDTDDLSLARQRVEEALEIDPASASAWWLRGDIANAAGRRAEAIEAYTELVNLSPEDMSRRDHFLARGQLVELLLEAGDIETAKGYSDTMVQLASRHPYPNYLAALVAYNRDDLRTATDHLQRALSADPDSVPTKALLGVIRLRQEQYAQAAGLLQDVVSARPEDAQVRGLLATALRGAGQDRQAARLLAEGVRRALGDPQALALLAAAAGDDATQVIRDLERFGDSDLIIQQARFEFARALVSQGNTDPAMALLQQADPENDTDGLTHRRLVAVTALYRGDGSRAIDEAQRLVADYPNRPESHALLGAVHLALEQPGAARDHLDNALRLDPEHPQSLINYGMLESLTGDIATAIEYLERGLQHLPGNVPTMLRLAELHQRAGNPEAAREWLDNALEIEPQSPQAAIALARLELALERRDAALAAADRAVRNAPDSAEAVTLQGLARLAADDARGAMASFGRARYLAPDNPDLGLHLARAQYAAGETEAAINLLSEVLENHPERMDARGALASLQLEIGDSDSALAMAREMQETDAGRLHGAYLEGHIRSIREETEAAETAFLRAAEGGLREALGPLVTVREQAGRERPAQPMEDWLETHPNDQGARMALANWYAERGHYRRASEHFEHLARLTNRKDPVVLNNLAWCYYQIGDERAARTAREAYALAPENPAIADTLGWLTLHAGDTETSLSLLRQAATRMPDDAQTQYHYGYALAAAGQNAEARERLERALAAGTEDNWVDEARELLESLRN